MCVGHADMMQWWRHTKEILNFGLHKNKKILKIR